MVKAAILTNEIVGDGTRRCDVVRPPGAAVLRGVLHA